MISLRPVERADYEAFFAHQSDPVAQEMAVFSARERDAFVAHWDRIRADGDTIARSVIVDGVVAGNVLSWSREGLRYVGYWIGREFWGRGIATEALRAICTEITARPIYALVADSNAGSKRVLEKAGFVATTDEARPADDGIPEWLYRLD